MPTKDFAEKFIKAENEAVLKGNFTLLKTLEDPHVIYHVPPLPDMVGHEARKQDILDAREGASDIKMEWEYLAGGGNILALSFKSSGRFVKSIRGRPAPIGKNYSGDYLFVLRLSKGMVAEAWVYGNVVVLE